MCKYSARADEHTRLTTQLAERDALLSELGEPILSSTLIPPGTSEPLNDPAAIRAQYEHALDLIIDSGACHLEPTTVVDLATDPPVIVRLGRGPPAQLGLSRATA